MKIHPILFVLSTLFISCIFSIIILRPELLALQSPPSTAPSHAPVSLISAETTTSSHQVPPASFSAATLIKPEISLPIAIDSIPTLIRDARLRLISQSSVSADLVHTYFAPDRRVVGRGRYLQAPHMKVKYTLEFPDEQGTVFLQQICDSHILWTHKEISPIPADCPPEEKSQYIRITRRNVEKILAEAGLHGQSSNMLTIELGLGGLTGLLASLESNIEFASIQTLTCQNRPCHVAYGEWNQKASDAWNEHKSHFRSTMSVYRPSAVEIWLDQETLFPAKINYLRTDAKRPQPLLTIEFEHVELGLPISSAEFDYQPPANITPTDTTRDFLN